MDFYAVLGVKKDSSAVDLKNAYRKLAMKWHPDRCSSLGNLKQVEEAKKKFQAIQHAYSVLSDDSKRLVYDLGLYNNDDDDNGMADFLSEMADVMSQNKSSNGSGGESLADLKDLFVEMFQNDMDHSFASSSSSSHSSYSETSNASHKRNSNQMNQMGKSSGNTSTAFDHVHFEGFSLGMGGTERRRGMNSSRSRK